MEFTDIFLSQSSTGLIISFSGDKITEKTLTNQLNWRICQAKLFDLQTI